MKKFLIFIGCILTILFIHLNVSANDMGIHYSIASYENNAVETKVIKSQIHLSDYQLYQINDYYEYEFYLFDVLEKSVSNVYEIKCISQNANYDYKIKNTNNSDLNNCNTLEILVVEKNILEIIYVPLEYQDYASIIKNATLIDFYENNELVERLKESLSFEFVFKSKLYSQRENAISLQMQTLAEDFNNSEIYCNQKNTVKYGACSDYTSTNSCINQLKEDKNFFMGQSFNKTYFTDSPIVYAIPKKYFMTRGIYSYIGPEYGFYINTYQDTGDDNISNFIIFDIKTKKKAYDQNGEVCIQPFLTGYAKYKRSNQIVTYEMDTSNLALTNINLSVALYNQTEKNIGDDGYIAEQDYGYAFKGFGLDTKVSLKNSKKNDDQPAFILAKLAAIGLKFIPKVGPYIGIAANAAIAVAESNHYKTEAATQYSNLSKSGDSYKNTSFNLESSDSVYTMISNYGNLLKGINVNMQQEEANMDSNNPLLYKTYNNDYFKVTYGFMQHNSDICWDTTILTKLSLDIVEDNTGTIIYEYGSVDYKDSVTGSWIDSFNENPTIKETRIYLDNVYAVEYGAKSYQLLNFTPTYSGNYTFETFGTEADTIMELLQDGTFLDDSDDDGSYINSSSKKWCSKISWNLTSGKKYTIKIYGYNDLGGYCNVRVKKSASEIQECTDGNFICNNNNYTSESYWQEFIPKKTDYYVISTNSSDCAVNLTIYDHNHNRLATDYYAGYSGKVIIYLYLHAGQKYYVQSKIYGYMGRNYSFGIFLLNTNCILRPSENYSEEFVLDESHSNIQYTIIVSETKNYTLGVERASGYNFLRVSLYDENFNLIQKITTLNSKVLYPIDALLTKNKCYYLYIEQIPEVVDRDDKLTVGYVFVKGN